MYGKGGRILPDTKSAGACTADSRIHGFNTNQYGIFRPAAGEYIGGMHN